MAQQQDKTASAAFSEVSKKNRDYTSTNWENIYQASEALLGEVLAKLPADEKPQGFFGLSVAEVRELHNTYKKTSLDPGKSLEDVRNGLKFLSKEELGALAQIEAVQGYLWTGAHVMAERNQKNFEHGIETFDRTERRKSMIETVRMMKDAGYSAEDIKDIYSHRKSWPTFTPHPTKDKSDIGEELYRGQAHITDTLPADQREQAMVDLIQKMLTSEITPRKKDTYADETRDGLAVQNVYNNGIANYFEDLQSGFNEVFGVGAIDFLAGDMHMDVASRKWHGGDADGKKIPATILFNQRVEDALGAISLYLAYLEQAHGKGAEKFKEPIVALKQIESNLKNVSAQAEEIETAGSASVKFITAQDEFIAAFTGINYKEKEYESGPRLTEAIVRDIGAIAVDEDASPAVRSAAWRTSFLHKQSGMAMGRTELRHNAEDYNRIFENLYSYLKENRPDVITEKEVKKLEDLSSTSQLILLNRLMGSHKGQMKEWLIAANREGWGREILERFHMMSKCYNKERMGTAIIAEADPTSAGKQQLLAESFSIGNMAHIALNENLETIQKAAKSLAKYTKKIGGRNLEDRRQNGNTDVYFIMDPQSDSHKEYGLFIKAQQLKTMKNLITLALELNLPVCTKIGTGASHARGGFSPKAVSRVFLNALTAHPDWETLNADQRKIMRQMVSFVSTTIQGRDAGLRLGTDEQVYCMMSDLDHGMIAGCMAIDRKIPPDIAAPRPTKFSPAMEAVLKEICEKQCIKYSEIVRGLECTSIGELSTRRIDKYMSVLPVNITEFTNVGARPPSRDGKKLISRARAIGCNIAIANTNTYFDGSCGIGSFMQVLHKRYKDGKITKSDLQDFVNDEFFMKQIFSNAMSALASADYEYGFEKVSGSKEIGTVKMLKDSRNHNYDRMNANLAYHTVLADDAIRATAYIEALLSKKGFDQTHEEIMSKIYKPEDTLRSLKFGPKTKTFYPDIEQLQAYAPKKKLMSAILNEADERIRLHQRKPESESALNPDDDMIKPLLHHIALAHRNLGPINMNNLLDQPGMAFGSRPVPVMGRIFDYIYKSQPPAPHASAENTVI